MTAALRGMSLLAEIEWPPQDPRLPRLPLAVAWVTTSVCSSLGTGRPVVCGSLLVALEAIRDGLGVLAAHIAVTIPARDSTVRLFGMAARAGLVCARVGAEDHVSDRSRSLALCLLRDSGAHASRCRRLSTRCANAGSPSTPPECSQGDKYKYEDVRVGSAWSAAP